MSEPLARQHRMIPINRAEDTVTLAMAQPQDVAAREQFRMLVNLDVKPVLAFERDITAVIETYSRIKAQQAEAKPSGPEPSRLERLKQRGRPTAVPATDPPWPPAPPR